jgi:carotenoid cleavage dioxygenase-like enzyme
MTTTQAARTQATGAEGGFQSLREEVTGRGLEVEGALPEWLAGDLVRVTPAELETGRTQLRHWFDGLAMLHKFSFADGRVTYANRALDSGDRRAAQAAAELKTRMFATDPCRSLFKRVTTTFSGQPTDNGNVNVARIAGRYIAMTETPIPIEFDRGTLATAGRLDLEGVPGGQLSTAHPHHDRGELVNFTAKLGRGASYRVYVAPDSGGPARIVASVSTREPAYMHSFALTERYAVLLDQPFVVNPLSLLTSNKPYIENYRWKPERGTRFLILDRHSGELSGIAETEALFCFHHVNAFERDGELVIDLCAYPDPGIIDALYLDRLRAGRFPTDPVELRRYRMDPSGGEARGERLVEHDFELPRIDYGRRNGKPYRVAWGVGSSEPASEHVWLDRIVRADVEAGTTTHWEQDGCFPGEPVFVAAPGSEAEDGGVLLSVVLDTHSQSSFLLVLDARTLEELARARAPHRIPFGFHGNHFGEES